MADELSSPFRGAVEPPSRELSRELQDRLKLIACIGGGLLVIIAAVAAISM